MPLQLRYCSDMAEKQEESGILEKVKNLALGTFLSQLYVLTVGESAEKKGDKAQKKDKKKDKKQHATSSLEVSSFRGLTNHSSPHLLNSSHIVLKSGTNIGLNMKLN